MIEQVTNLKKKSFNNYTGPSERFKQKSIIFGYNGRGKSSLAFGIKDEYLSDSTKNEDSLRFFNNNYINDSLGLEDPTTGKRSRVKGVIAHFGAKDVKSEKEIKILENSITDLKPLMLKIDELKVDVRKAVDTIHDRRKGTASIQKRSKSLEVDKVIDLYEQDLAEAKKIEPDEQKLSKIEGDNVIGEKIELLRTIGFQSFDKISDEDITKASEIFSKSYDNIDIPSSEIVEWMNEGVNIHENGDDCKFCGGNLALDDIRERVHEYNENTKQKAVKTLQSLNYKLAELQNTIQSTLDSQANTVSSLEDDSAIGDSYEKIVSASTVIATARNAVKEKIKDIDGKQVFIDFTESLNNYNAAIESLNDIKNSQLKNLETKNNNKDILVKGAIGLEIVGDTTVQDKLGEILDQAKILEEITTENKRIQGEIQKLKQAKSATSDFADYISGILTSLNINLKLIVSDDGKNYIIQHTHSSAELTLSDISEGERNLMALLFFYYELFLDNKQQDFKSDIELIIVDDPVSSMDDINKMYILELMKQLLSLDAPQVVVMTHSWDDFSNICYGFHDKAATTTQPATPYGFYEIKKDALGNSLVQRTKSNIPPYHHNFAEVYEFSQRPDTTSLDDCDIYHMPNIMRQVLEGFLGFKTRNTSPTSSNRTEIGQVLYNKDWSSITEAEKTDLGKLLLVANVNSHSSSRSPDEIWQSAKFLMKRIANVDKRHFDTNKAPVIA